MGNKTDNSIRAGNDLNYSNKDTESDSKEFPWLKAGVIIAGITVIVTIAVEILKHFHIL